MNPEYKVSGGILSYPVFCYGSHSILWLQEDLIYENSAANYSKYLKAGRNKLKSNKEIAAKFEAALDELESDPCVNCDLKSIKDLRDFFDGNR